MKDSIRVQNQNLRHRSDQRGMAALIITMVTMVVISLIVIGFATVSRREQRQSLDQLQSTQAFYAAESGVEDARAVIKARIVAGQAVIAKNSCTTNDVAGGTYPTNGQTLVDATYDSSYTCLKVNPNPTSLDFDGIGDNSLVVPINATSPIGSVTVTWRPSTVPAGSPAADCPATATGSFSPQSGVNSWKCGYGVLRVSLVPTDGTLSRAGLTNSQLTGFFVPLNSSPAGNLVYGVANNNHANVTAANCTSTPSGGYATCKATISNIDISKAVSLRINSLYQPSNISIQAFSPSGTALGVNGVQAVVDSTGKAADVLRRIVVRLPLIQTGGLLPGQALTSNGSICKRFSTTATSFEIPADIVSPDGSNAMCLSKTDP